MRKALSTASGLAIALVLVVAAPALAQEGGGTPQADSGAGLAEIVVTAQRREENLQRAAISVTAITGDQLTRRGVSDVGQLQNIAPALQVSNSYGPTNQFTLRGVGNVVLNVNIDAAIITNLDGVPITRPTSVHGLFYDLERIEVLKGPQGTLYGRNATGGAINAITQQPKFGELSGYVNGSYGNYDALILNGAVNLPVADNAALRIAGTLSQHDGYYSDGLGDQRLRAGRATFKADLADDVTLTISGDYAKNGGKGSGATLAAFDHDLRVGLQDPRSGPIYSGTFSLPTFAFLSPLTLDNFQDNQMWGLSANLEIGTSIGTVTIQPAYRKTRLDFLTSAGGFYAPVDESNEQKSLEVRLVSDKGQALQYIFGAFYIKEDNKSLVGFNQHFFAAYGEFSPSSEAYAGYGRLTYSVTPEFRVSAAARYTSDKRGSYQDVVNGIVVCPGATFGNPASWCVGTPGLPVGLTPPAAWSNPAGGFLPAVANGNGGLAVITYGGAFTASKTFNKLTWRAGLEYDVAPQSLLYATFETGFKAGGFFNSPDPDPSFEPETVDAFTIGSKNRFLDNRLQLNIEGFWWTYKNKQFSHIIPVTGGTTFATENVGKSRLRGVEIEALAKPFANTTFNLDIQYLDAKEVSFAYDSLDALGPPSTGCSFTGPSNGFYRVDCSGLRSVNSPEWTINVGFEQAFPLANGATIKVNGQTRYQSQVQTSYDYFAVGLQDGYFTSDVFVTYEAPDNRYFISGFINNIEDTAAVTYTQPHPRGTIPLLARQSLTSPRTYGVRVGFKF